MDIWQKMYEKAQALYQPLRFAIAVLNLVLLGTTRLGKIGDMD